MFKPAASESLTIKKELLEQNSELLVTLTLSGEIWKEAIVEAKKGLSKGAKVPGFREGKAPSFLSTRDIPQERLLRQALSLIEGYCHSEAVRSIREERYRFSSQPRLEVKELLINKLTITLAYPFFPDFDLPNFSVEDKIKVGDISITREDLVVNALNMAKPLGLTIDSEPASKVGYHDVVNIDFEVGLIGEESKDTGPNSGNIEIVIGSGMLLPAVERELIGMEDGGEGRFEITFPEFYPKLDYRNKKGYFKVKVLGIKRSKPPLIKEVDLPRLGFSVDSTLADLNSQLERVSQAAKVDLVRNIFRRDLLSVYLPKISIIFSEFQVLTNQRYMLERFLSGLETNGITLEDYLKDTGGSKESIFEELRGETLKSLKTQALLERIIELNKITVNDEEIDRYRNLLATFYRRPAEEIDKTFSRDQISSLIIDQKLLVYLMEACDPEGAKRLEEVDFFSLKRPEGDTKTPLEKLHLDGKSLFNLYPLSIDDNGLANKEDISQ